MKKYFFSLLMFAILTVSCNKNGENNNLSTEEKQFQKELIGTSWVKSEQEIWPNDFKILTPDGEVDITKEEIANMDIHLHSVMFFTSREEYISRRFLSIPESSSSEEEYTISRIELMYSLHEKDYNQIRKTPRIYLDVTNEQSRVWEIYKPHVNKYEIFDNKIECRFADTYVAFEKKENELVLVDSSNSELIGDVYNRDKFLYLWNNEKNNFNTIISYFDSVLH